MIERLFYLGATHKTAALHVREQLAASPERLSRLLVELRRVADEALILNTCGRFEIYLVVSPARQLDWPVWLGPILKQPASTLREYLNMRSGTDAAVHALRVAAGLDSRIVGEDQILGQVRRAFELATRLRAVGPMLSTLFRTAIHAGRRVRMETSLGCHGRCFARLAVDAIQMALSEKPARSASEDVSSPSTILILGTGGLARNVAEELWHTRTVRLRFVSRHVRRAQQLAAEFHGEGFGVDSLPRLLATADAVIGCAATSRPLIEAGMFVRARRPHSPGASGWFERTRSLTIVDLGMPRNVDPVVATLPGITQRDLESLGLHGAESDEDAFAAERIIDEAIRRFTDWLRGRAAAPRISNLLQSLRTADEPPTRAKRRELHQRILRLKQEAAA